MSRTNRSQVSQEFATDEAFLDGGGELGALMRAYPWDTTPLGPPGEWPRSLKTAVRIMLTSRQPFWLGWGPELTYLYNDPYKSIIGGKHPQALGRPFKEVWHEIWDVVGPMADTVMNHDEGTYVEAQQLIMERHGYKEETYYTFSYSPIPNDDGGPGGLICANTDDTRRVIGERQLALLREQAAKSADARSWQSACDLTIEALSTDSRDIVFALIFFLDPDGKPRLEGGTTTAGELSDPDRWPIARVIESQCAQVEVLTDQQIELPCGAWSTPPTRAAVLPISTSGESARSGVLVIGLNPFRQFDERYLGFLELVAGQVSAAFSNAQAYAEERRRAEVLAELDRAKTTFFNNVSHEFRTPLTLMLGPVEDMLTAQPEGLQDEQRQLLAIIKRNGLRLLKLVNTLLDFARIEAGRTQACFEPTDISELTIDLASNFRSAYAQAGLAYRVECPNFDTPAYIDRGMWEKIVLNLLSNALKFTLEGEVSLRLEETATEFLLSVTDTGTGIPEDALPHTFDRFHRVEGARGRSHEGSGIGLALVQEFVKLHGGTVGVQSRLGSGTTFTVGIPKGNRHLPAEQVKETSMSTGSIVNTDAYIEEAMSWISDAGDVQASPQNPQRVLLADDNADLRQYVQRLLVEHYEVESVADGEAALAAARARRPDVIISDVMMPRLDGFGLIQALRADPQLCTIPVILLSARAGEEARIEGLESGADDYIAKPFSARDLLVRIGALLKSEDIRNRTLEQERHTLQKLKEGEERLRFILAATGTGYWELELDQGAAQCSPEHDRIFGYDQPVPDWNYDLFLNTHVHPDDREAVDQKFKQDMLSAEGWGFECRIIRVDGSLGWIWVRGGISARSPEGHPTRLSGLVRDITERKEAEQALQDTRTRLEMTLSAAEVATWTWDIREDRVVADRNLARLFSVSEADAAGAPLAVYVQAIHPDDLDRVMQEIQHAVDTGASYEVGYHVRDKDGQYRYVIARGITEYAPDGTPLRMPGVVIDITEQKRAEQAARENEERFRTLADAAPSFIWHTDETGVQRYVNRFYMEFVGKHAKDITEGNWRTLIHPEERQEYLESFGRAVQTRSPYRARARIQRHDGQWRWIESHALPLISEDGGFHGHVGISLDINTTVEHEQALRESEAYLRLVLDTAASGFYSVDKDSVTTVCNESLLRMIGIEDSEAVIGKHLQDVVRHARQDGSQYPREECPIHRAIVLGESSHVVDEYLYRVDGSRFPVEYWTYPIIREGEIRGAVTTLIDITERKAAEEALLRSEEAARHRKQVLDVALTASATGIFRYDIAERRFLEFDRNLKQLFGLNADQPVQIVEDFLAVVHPDDLPMVVPAVERTIGEGLDFEMEFRVIHPDGSVHWLFDRAKLERDPATGMAYLVGACTDVTERKQSEEAARAAAVENAKLVETLRDEDRRKNEFIATLSHELRNPLAPLRNGLHILRLQGADIDQSTIHAMMERQLDHMVRLVDDLLEMSRISRGTFELRKEPVEVGAVIRNALETSGPVIEDAGHRIRVTQPDEALWVDGDPVRLAQIIANLLNNAAIYTDVSGEIELQVRRHDADVAITVRDHGIGIEAAMLPRLFDAFTRGGLSQSRGRGGLGIGLALARRLAEMHGGTLNAHSAGLGQGAEFTLTLPLDTKLAPTPSEPAPAASAVGQRRILVVDDNQDAADSLAMILNMQGAEVRVAHGGRAALDLYADFKPEVVLLDIGMPEVDGYEVARRIRQDDADAQVTIVALTGWGQEEDRRKTAGAGFDHHLTKPVQVDELQQLLTSL